MEGAPASTRVARALRKVNYAKASPRGASSSLDAGARVRATGTSDLSKQGIGDDSAGRDLSRRECASLLGARLKALR